jgi:hypothetical protein
MLWRGIRMVKTTSSKLKACYAHFKEFAADFPIIPDTMWTGKDSDLDLFVDVVRRHRLIMATKLYVRGQRKRAVDIYMSLNVKGVHPTQYADAERTAEGALRLMAQITGVK